jgi:SAM-dependent methyltransferase
VRYSPRGSESERYPSTVTEPAATKHALARERDHWDHVVPTVDEVLAEYYAGPISPAAAMIDALGPIEGRRILDFACGGGTTSLWLAARGADVVGIDLSPASIAVAKSAAERAGLSVDFRVVSGRNDDLGGPYDGIVGHFALHHVDVRETCLRLAEALRLGGMAAFVETTADNPVLRAVRNRLPRRLSVGTPDEHPLTHADRATLRDVFGDLEVTTPWYQFLWLFDRQILRFRWPRVSRAINRADMRLRDVHAISDWSYTKLFIVRKTVER